MSLRPTKETKRAASSNGDPRSGDPLAAALDRLSERLAKLESRVDDLRGELDAADEASEVARANAERKLNRHVEALCAEAEAKLTRKQRRQELKLARQERDRTIQEAERRLPERAQQLVAEIEREGAVAEKRVSTAREHAERALDDVIGDAAIRIQNRVQSVLDIEGKLVALLDQSAAAAERVRVADERASVAEHHVLEIKQAVHR